MTPRLYPREEGRSDIPVESNPRGTRIFRVTDRIMDQRTRLIIAPTPEDAIKNDATEINVLSREKIHEVVECVEYQPLGPSYQSPAQRVES